MKERRCDHCAQRLDRKHRRFRCVTCRYLLCLDCVEFVIVGGRPVPGCRNIDACQHRKRRNEKKREVVA